MIFKGGVCVRFSILVKQKIFSVSTPFVFCQAVAHGSARPAVRHWRRSRNVFLRLRFVPSRRCY